MTNDEVQEIIDRAEDEYDRLKDRVHEQYDEIERLNKEKEILQCDLDNVNGKLRESMSIRLKAIDILKNNIIAYISKKPFDETIPRVIRILQGSDKE